MDTTTHVYPFGSDIPLSVSGVFKCSVENGQKKTMCTFFVIKGDCFNVLGSKALGLIKVVTAVSTTVLHSHK